MKSFSGCVNSLWTVLSQKYTSHKTLYDDQLRMCLAVSSCHVNNGSLKQAETIYFAGVRERLYFVSSEQMEMREASQERYGRICRERMAGFVRRSLFAETASG